MFHPRSANWFDLIVQQSGLAAVLEVLAGMKAIELEADAREMRTPVDLLDLHVGLENYGDLARRYREFWPDPDRGAPLSACSPPDVLDATLARVQDWAAAAAPLIDKLQLTVRQEADLHDLSELLDAAKQDFPMRLLSGGQGELFGLSIHLLDDGRMPEHVPTNIYTRVYKARMGVYLVAIGEKVTIAGFADELAAFKARSIHLPEISSAFPSGLTEESVDGLAEVIAARIEALRIEQDQARQSIAVLSTQHGIARARANIERLRWLANYVGETATTALFARITGWTALDRASMEHALDRLGLDYALSLGNAPEGQDSPMLFDNPPWVRPFEAFVRLLGMPARTEADPSPLVALIAPLLFGFMFGDVGQGAVLLTAGLVLRHVWPATAILVPGGVFAILFGFAFGSVFAREDVIGAFWLHPLAQPIPVLGVALGMGVVILLTGLVLGGAGAHWQGKGRTWWIVDAGLLAAYIGVVVSFASVWGLALTAAGALWFLGGSTIVATSQRAEALGLAFGGLVESLFQLLINTLSFIRVGAFAIAHAGLSSAVVVLADITGDTIGFWVIMVVGNGFIIILEGLVAGIQTTRLMLFEFFIRFLHAEGRPLRVLPTPVAWSTKQKGKTT